jgi:hypothetical protein
MFHFSAQATSAAPGYFKSFSSEKTGHTFIDGGLCHNNPVLVANTERNLLWPHLKNEPPALLLSIGTGWDSTSKSGNKEPKIKRGSLGFMRHVATVVWDQLQTTLDCQRTWENFIRLLNLTGDDERKYCRLNLDYRENLPKLDEVDKLDFLEQTAREHFSQDSCINQVADTLVASLFYFKLNSTQRVPNSEVKWKCQG